jgi:hypothetical protein
LHNITAKLFAAIDKHFPDGNDKLKSKVAVAHNNLINKYNAATPEQRTAFLTKLQSHEDQIKNEVATVKAMTTEEKEAAVQALIDRVNGVQVPVDAGVAAAAPQKPVASTTTTTV